MTAAQTSAQGRETRFAGWRPVPARLLLMLVAIVIAYGVAIAANEKPPAIGVASTFSQSDAALYRTVAARVGAGEGYYAAVVGEHRARDYPLRPFVTVRLPVLAWLSGALGTAGAAWLYRAIALAAVLVLAHRLATAGLPRAEWMSTLVIAGAAMALLAIDGLSVWHEAWAAMLIVLSLGSRSKHRWAASVVLGLAAVCIRELALPYLLLMAFFAWRERAWTELAGWVGAVLCAGAVLAAHALTLAGLVSDADLASPGWSDAEGWSFVLLLAQRCTPMALLPLAAVAVIVPVSLLGWSAWKSPLGERVLVLLGGYLAAFMLIGRPDNFYWGLLVSPLLLSGLAFAPRGLRDLVAASRTARAVS